MAADILLSLDIVSVIPVLFAVLKSYLVAWDYHVIIIFISVLDLYDNASCCVPVETALEYLYCFTN